MSQRLDQLAVPGTTIARAVAPAVLATFMASLGFAALKFVLIGELALDFNPADHHPLPIQSLEDVVQACIARGNIREAITQGLAAAITLGVILGYLVNAPLAGAWSTARLFLASGFCVAAGTMIVLVVNPWPVMVLVGIAYGAACAARGKCVPLLASQQGMSNTLVSGIINTAMVLGLLSGTLLGTLLYDQLDLPRTSHLIIAGTLLLSALAGAFIKTAEPPPIPLRHGMRDLFQGSLALIIRHWPLLAGGGMAWGIASAASLAIFVDAVERLQLPETRAITLVLFPALGAIIGNLVSHRMVQRHWVVCIFLVMGAITVAYPWVVAGYWTAAAFALMVGGLFAAGSNVLDARFLKKAAEEGQAGRGSTMMSLTHSVFIFIVGTGLAVALLLSWIAALDQFLFLAGCALITAAVAAFAKLSD